MRGDWVNKLTLYTNCLPKGNYTIYKYKKNEKNT